MDMQTFIERIDTLGWGVGAFNTYHLNGVNHCYIMISEKGSRGRFLKEECIEYDLNETLQKTLNRLVAGVV